VGQEPVVSDRVLPGKDGWSRRGDESKDDGSTIKMHLCQEIRIKKSLKHEEFLTSERVDPLCFDGQL
jgi:hypothetical protein